MKAVLQRVNEADVTVAGESIGRIKKGLLVYLGVERGDGPADIDYITDKVCYLRIFADASGRMNLDVKSAGGAVLVVSQFTLLGDCAKGRRPSFSRAEAPDKAEELYGLFIKALRQRGLSVKEGRFGANMEVRSLNNGPVTMLLDSRL